MDSRGTYHEIYHRAIQRRTRSHTTSMKHQTKISQETRKEEKKSSSYNTEVQIRRTYSSRVEEEQKVKDQ